jgi:hypothetical protein
MGILLIKIYQDRDSTHQTGGFEDFICQMTIFPLSMENQEYMATNQNTPDSDSWYVWLGIFKG